MDVTFPKIARLPRGAVITADLVRIATLSGLDVSTTTLSTLTDRGIVAPLPCRFAGDTGRPSRVWDLDETLQKLADHFAA